MLQNLCVSFRRLCRPWTQSYLSRGWFSRNSYQDQNSKALPKVMYLQSPLGYLQTRIQLLKLRLLWDREFVLNEFIRGTKQSTIVMTNCIRDQDGIQIGNFTTPMGFQQITRDMILSRNDVRLKLVHLRVEDILRAVPMKVSLLQRGGRKHCFIDMAFLGMRNTRDFSDPQESQMILQNLRQLDKEKKTSFQESEVSHRILYAEIYMRFYRNYSPDMLEDWTVSFYKIISFDILNYK